MRFEETFFFFFAPEKLSGHKEEMMMMMISILHSVGLWADMRLSSLFIYVNLSIYTWPCVAFRAMPPCAFILINRSLVVTDIQLAVRG